MDTNSIKVAIIGGGLVGSLSACYFGQRGYDVHLFEYRKDIRECELVQGRSINLALSNRGREALKRVGLEEKIREYGIPMYGRMIHSVSGKRRAIPYDPVYKQCIYSVGRKYLNEALLNEAERYPNVHLNFEMKLVGVNLDDNKLIFKGESGGDRVTTADLIIGADGAFSTVRRELVKRIPINYSQTYVPHGYLELAIPPHNNHKMEGSHLHIWPRGKFMMIALPNQDCSWTVTLFMPHSEFELLNSEKKIKDFFRRHFPDAIDLIGEENLFRTILTTTPSLLMTVKNQDKQFVLEIYSSWEKYGIIEEVNRKTCSKYNYGSNAVIIGDAAHAMVPFYGQGMNSGFEDCQILDDLLHNHSYTVEEALDKFSQTRNPNAEMICDLAMYNYIEMRDLVNRPTFLFRRILDNFLYKLFPSVWIPLYQSVTFSSREYQSCAKNREWQDSVLRKVSYTSGIVAVCLILFHYGKPHIRSFNLMDGIKQINNKF